jgi:hypothetical protein
MLCRTRMVHLTNNSKYLAESVKKKRTSSQVALG